MFLGSIRTAAAILIQEDAPAHFDQAQHSGGACQDKRAEIAEYADKASSGAVLG